MTEKFKVCNTLDETNCVQIDKNNNINVVSVPLCKKGYTDPCLRHGSDKGNKFYNGCITTTEFNCIRNEKNNSRLSSKPNIFKADSTTDSDSISTTDSFSTTDSVSITDTKDGKEDKYFGYVKKDGNGCYENIERIDINTGECVKVSLTGQPILQKILKDLKPNESIKAQIDFYADLVNNDNKECKIRDGKVNNDNKENCEICNFQIAQEEITKKGRLDNDYEDEYLTFIKERTDECLVFRNLEYIYKNEILFVPLSRNPRDGDLESNIEFIKNCNKGYTNIIEVLIKGISIRSDTKDNLGLEINNPDPNNTIIDKKDETISTQKRCTEEEAKLYICKILNLISNGIIRFGLYADENNWANLLMLEVSTIINEMENQRNYLDESNSAIPNDIKINISNYIIPNMTDEIFKQYLQNVNDNRKKQGAVEILSEHLTDIIKINKDALNKKEKILKEEKEKDSTNLLFPTLEGGDNNNILMNKEMQVHFTQKYFKINQNGGLFIEEDDPDIQQIVIDDSILKDDKINGIQAIIDKKINEKQLIYEEKWLKTLGTIQMFSENINSYLTKIPTLCDTYKVLNDSDRLASLWADYKLLLNTVAIYYYDKYTTKDKIQKLTLNSNIEKAETILAEKRTIISQLGGDNYFNDLYRHSSNTIMPYIVTTKNFITKNAKKYLSKLKSLSNTYLIMIGAMVWLVAMNYDIIMYKIELWQYSGYRLLLEFLLNKTTNIDKNNNDMIYKVDNKYYKIFVAKMLEDWYISTSNILNYINFYLLGSRPTYLNKDPTKLLSYNELPDYDHAKLMYTIIETDKIYDSNYTFENLSDVYNKYFPKIPTSETILNDSIFYQLAYLLSTVKSIGKFKYNANNNDFQLLLNNVIYETILKKAFSTSEAAYKEIAHYISDSYHKTNGTEFSRNQDQSSLKNKYDYTKIATKLNIIQDGKYTRKNIEIVFKYFIDDAPEFKNLLKLVEFKRVEKLGGGSIKRESAVYY